MEIMLTNIANYGFPMIVSVFLLTRIEKRLETLALNVAELTGTIDKKF